MNTITTYPKYFRKAGTCVKVISEQTSRTIILPPQVPAAERFSDTFPSAERLQEELKDFQETTEQTWKDFSFSFCMSVTNETFDRHNKVKAELKELTTKKEEL